MDRCIDWILWKPKQIARWLLVRPGFEVSQRLLVHTNSLFGFLLCMFLQGRLAIHAANRENLQKLAALTRNGPH